MSVAILKEPGDGWFSMFIIAYAVVRLVLILEYFRAYSALPVGQPLTGRFMVGFSLALICMITAIVISCYKPTSQWKYSPAIIGMSIDYGTPFFLLPRMETVHPSHITDRFASFSILMFTGMLFNFVQILGSPADDTAAIPTYLECVTLGVGLSFSLVLIFSKVPPPRVEGFESPIPSCLNPPLSGI